MFLSRCVTISTLALLVIGCTTYHDVYRTASFSPAHRDGSLVQVGLKFLRVDPDGTVVIRYKTSLVREMRGKPGQYLSDAISQSGLLVVSSSPKSQTVVIKYLYSTDRPTR
jgi:hypothetical protein